MRRYSFAWCMALLFLLLRPATAQDETKHYEISNFDVTIRVTPDGTYEVEETITYDFQRGTFTYAYRSIDDDNVTAIRDVRVTSPDVTVDSLQRTEEDGDVRLRWTYPERSSPATFRIRYVVAGALYRRGTQNVVSRDVLDAGATVPTRDIDVSVVLPDAFDLTPEAVSVVPAPEGTVQQSAEGIVAAFDRSRVEVGEEYPVEVAFPKRLPGRYWPTGSDMLVGVFLFLVGLGGGIGLNLYWKGPKVEAEATRPPRDVSLPEGAVLLEKAATPLFTAVLFDLARRGHLTLQHDEESSWSGTSEVVRLDLHPTPADLSDFERGVVERLDSHETVGDFWKNSGSYRRSQFRAVRRRVVDAEWMTAHRARSTGLFVGAVLVLGGGIGLGLVASGSITLFTILGSIGIGTGALIAGARRYTMTEAGARRAGRLLSYLDNEKKEIDRLCESNPTRAAERLAEALPWLVYDANVSASWLGEVKEALSDAETVPTLPEGFVSLVEQEEAASVAAFVPIVSVMSAMEASGAGAAGTAGAAGAVGGAAGGAAGAG